MTLSIPAEATYLQEGYKSKAITDSLCPLRVLKRVGSPYDYPECSFILNKLSYKLKNYYSLKSVFIEKFDKLNDILNELQKNMSQFNKSNIVKALVETK